jgi:hypothetical protein
MPNQEFQYIGEIQAKSTFYPVYRKGWDYYTPFTFEGSTYYMLVFKGLKHIDESKLWEFKLKSEVKGEREQWNSLAVGIRAARKILHSLHEHGFDPDGHLHFLKEHYPSLHGYALTWQQMLNDVAY